MIDQEVVSHQTADFMDPGFSPVAPNSDVEVSFIDILTQLAHRKVLVAKVTGSAMLCGVILSFVLPVKYTSATKLMPPQQTQSSASLLMSQLTSSGAGALAAVAGAGLGLKNPNDLYIGLLKSRPVADGIIRRFDLAKVYGTKDMTATRRILAADTQIASEKEGFISVSVTDKDKTRAADIANAYTGQLRILTNTLAVTEASQRRLFYEEQLKRTKEDLIGAEQAFEQVQQKKGVVELEAQAKAMIESLTTLRGKVAAQQVEVEALRSYSTEQNPDVELAERQLSSMQNEVASLEQRSHSTGVGDVALGDVPVAGLEYLRAQHEVMYQQALFDMLMKQYDAARLDEAKEAAVVQVVEPAIPPDRKSAPWRTLLIALFTAGGLLAGCLLALISWWRELVRLDPVAEQQLTALHVALSGRRGAGI